MNVEMSWIDELVQRFGADREPARSVAVSSMEEISRVEDKLHAPLPPSYRYFVEHYGGVMLGNDDFFPVAPIAERCPCGDETRPESFYGLDESFRYSVFEALATFANRLPTGVLPISHDAGGNQICLDVGGAFPGTVFFWDHEQRWFDRSWQDIAAKLDASGVNTRRMSPHDVIRYWSRSNGGTYDRPPDYMGMYRMSPSFEEFLRSLRQQPY